MTKKITQPILVALTVLLAGVALSPGHASACEMAEVKVAIDNVLDKDPALGKKFRKEFDEGSDSIHILEQLVSEDMRKKVDICRFHVAEYLTKRGFPPPH